jgi:MFS transporter, DHA3 family, macrolide efflux protein
VQVWVAASTISALGDAVFTIALAWTAVHMFSATVAGLVIGIETVPQALLTLAGGVLADRCRTRRVLIIGDVARAAILTTATGLWCAHVRNLGVLLAVALAFGVVAGLSRPARATLARQLVRGSDLAVLAGWTQIGGRIAVLAGAPLGGMLVATGGLASAMVADALTFAVTCIALGTVVRPRWPLREAPAERWSRALPELGRYLRADATARALTVGICSLNVFVTPVESVGVALRVAHSHWGAAWVGVAGACLGVAAIAGSAAAMRWRSGRIAARGFWTLVLQGVALAAVGIGTRTSLLCAMAGIGLTAGLASVWISSVFQRRISPAHLGRVSSVSQLGDQTVVPVMLPLFGWFAASAGVLPATCACGSAMALLCAAVATRPTVRELR